MDSPVSPAHDPVEVALQAIARGGFVIVTDDENRENEGDLILAAEHATPQAVNFMARHARGLICAPITTQRADELDLPQMARHNREAQKTAFTISVDGSAAHGIGTGISASDRAKTLQLLANPSTLANEFVQPGHIFPLTAAQGGVLRRAGHTEATIDLTRLAGLQPAGVLCEILNEDGTMARRPQLEAFAAEHELPMLSIAELIAWRRRKECLVRRIESVRLPTDWGEFTLIAYETTIEAGHHVALVKGEIDPETPTLVRVHSECLTGDVFHSLRCDCGSQLSAAMSQIESAGNGVLLYMRQEGRGIGLLEKIRAYKLQEEGLDTVEANEKLGYPADLRDYGVGAQMLRDLGVRKMRLMTNNPKKVIGLEGHGLELVEQVPIKVEPSEHNRDYLDTKRAKLGHSL